MHRLASIVSVIVCAFLFGCTKYEYVVTAPAEFAGRLTKQERSLSREPIVFHLVDQSSRVGIRVENASDESITIKGEESYIVTPNGRSDPMRGGTIAPRTWTGLTVPPLVRTFERSGGASFGFGVGSWGDHGYGGVGVGLGGSPWDDSVYLPHDEVAWRWTDGAVRIHLVMEMAGEVPSRSEHDFTIERRRID